MSFQEGKPLKNLMYGLMHPMEFAEKKPLFFLGIAGASVFFLGIWQGWWSFDSVKDMIPFID
jgi:hypothetical protein